MTKKIPEPTKRVVRQVSGFGCCKCGLPIIEYHHIVKDSENPDEIMLLCPIHHHEATLGAMPIEDQWHYKKKPYNIEKGFVQGQLKVNQTTPVINVGTNQFIGIGDFLIVDNESLLSLRINEGKLEVSIRLYDKNDSLVSLIQNNEWVSGDPLPWDIESSFQWLKIRRKLRDIEFIIDARSDPIDLIADIWRKGQNFQLSAKEIRFNGVKSNIGFVNMGFVALRLQADTSKKSIKIVPDPIFGKGHFISEPNLKKRIEKGLSEWKILSCNHEFETIIEKSRYKVRKCRLCQKVKKDWK